MQNLTNEEIRQAVRATYGKAATAGAGCGCGCDASTPEEAAHRMGYSSDDISTVPEGANMSLGCGNPKAIASLGAGETVLDLGSGAGFDCFLAGKEVGERGRVIGIDMTPEMISKARENARKAGVGNVEFRLGEIEHVPVADNTVDAIISNCVINLSTDKQRVFDEAFRVLKQGGRLAIADIVATADLPDEAKNDLSLIAGCTGGASLVDETRSMLEKAGFTNIRITPKDNSKEIVRGYWTPGSRIEDYLVSASIEATKS
jgi:SAM-dependent methyltransferase